MLFEIFVPNRTFSVTATLNNSNHSGKLVCNGQPLITEKYVCTLFVQD